MTSIRTPLLAATLISLASASPSFAVTVAKDPVSQITAGAQAYGLCARALSVEEEVIAGRNAAGSDLTASVGDLVNSASDARGTARVYRYSLGCDAEPTQALMHTYERAGR